MISKVAMNKLLKQGFSSFLRRRRALWHLERRPMLGSVATVPAALGQDVLTAAHDEPTAALMPRPPW